MIVLTDGKENEEPYIDAVKQGIYDANPNLHIYCVGIGNPVETGPWGNDGVQTEKLEAIATETGGMFRVLQSIAGATRYDLEAFYFKVFANATGRQTILDPLYVLPISPTLTEVAQVNIVACDRDADFLIISELFKIRGFELQIYLQDPTGQVMEAGAVIGGIAIHVKSWDKYKLVRIKFPSRVESQTYTGTWRLFLRPFQTHPSAELTHMMSSASSPKGNVTVAFMAAVGSDYRLQAGLTPGEILVGQSLHITATLTEAWWPRPGATVTVSATRPNGMHTSQLMFDDGLHADGTAGDGVYGVDFTNTGQKGYYEFLVRSQGQTERGENVTREAFLAKFIGPKPPDRPAGRACLPCWLVRVIFIIILFLLFAILIILIRCYKSRNSVSAKPE